MDLSSCNKKKYPKIYQQLATSIRDYPQIGLTINKDKWCLLWIWNIVSIQKTSDMYLIAHDKNEFGRIWDFWWRLSVSKTACDWRKQLLDLMSLSVTRPTLTSQGHNWVIHVLVNRKSSDRQHTNAIKA